MAWNFTQDWYFHAHPDRAFRAITERELPEGVRATAYAHEITDNIFHTTHYWLLSGSPSALRQAINGTGFVKSEDALVMKPDLHQLFGVPGISPEIVIGYEWELDRDRWYCLFAGETTGFYAH